MTEGDKIDALFHKIKRRFMEKTNEMLNRLQKTHHMAIDREREEVME